MSDVETAPEGAEVVSAPESTDTEIETSAPVENKEATPESSIDDTLKAVWRKSQRDEKGRFQSAEAPAEAAPEDETSVQSPEPEVPTVEVPNSWTAEAKAKWDKVPPELRPYLAQREAESHKTITRQGQELKTYESFKPVLERSRGIFQRYGVSETDGISQLLNANEYLENDPVSAIRDLAEAYGVDLRQLVGAPAQPGDVNHQLHAELQDLRRQLQETRTHVDRSAQEQSERQLKSIEEQVVAFARDKTDWSELEEDIHSQIIAIKAKNPDLPPNEVLAKAYETARRVNPATWEKLQKEQEAKKLEEARKRAAEAKKAAPLNVKSSTANTSAQKTIDDTLRAVWRRHQS